MLSGVLLLGLDEIVRDSDVNELPSFGLDEAVLGITGREWEFVESVPCNSSVPAVGRIVDNHVVLPLLKEFEKLSESKLVGRLETVAKSWKDDSGGIGSFAGDFVVAGQACERVLENGLGNGIGNGTKEHEGAQEGFVSPSAPSSLKKELGFVIVQSILCFRYC